MATLKQRLRRKNSSGSYDIVYLETVATVVKMSETDSTLLSTKISSMDTTIAGKAAASHNHSAANITSGTLAVARGGTGQTSVDTTPTSGSKKMCTSGGIYTALAGKQAAGSYAAASHSHNGANLSFDSTRSINDVINNNYSMIVAANNEISSLKSSVSSGKAQIASAITDKGVSTAASATFSQMASNIRNISTSNTSGINIWVYSEGMPASGTIYASKNGINIYGSYVSTFDRFRICLPASSFEGTWTIVCTYSNYSNSSTINISGNTTIDYFISIKVLPVLSGTWYLNDTLNYPSQKIRETFNGTTSEDYNTIKAQTVSNNGISFYKNVYGIWLYPSDNLIRFSYNQYEGESVYNGSWGDDYKYKWIKFNNQYTVDMAFYSWFINNAVQKS